MLEPGGDRVVTVQQLVQQATRGQPPAPDALGFMVAEIDDRAKKIATDSERHKKTHRRLRLATYLLTAATAIAAGVGLGVAGAQPIANLVVVVLTAAVGVVASIEAMLKPAELWIHERTLSYALKDLLREIEFLGKAGRLDAATVDQMFGRLQALLASSGEKWTNQIAAAPAAKPGVP